MTLENVQGSVADFRRGREPAQSNFRQKVQICTKINTSFNLTSFFFCGNLTVSSRKEEKKTVFLERARFTINNLQMFEKPLETIF